MQPALPTQEEHHILFQAFYNSDDLANFLLTNRFERVRALMPSMHRVLVIIGGTRTVKPHHVTTLACLLEEYRLGGVIIRFESVNRVVYQYLESIRFLARWTAVDSTPSHLLPSDPTAFTLWKVDQESMTAYARSAYQHFKAHFFQDKSFDFLPIYLGEMLNNVFDHAFAGAATERVAFAMLQYYPAGKRLFVTVSDFGMGIAKTVNRFLVAQGQEPVTATEALEKALVFRFTSQSKPHNQGRGLDTLRTGIRELNGMLTIQTSRAIYHVSREGKVFNHALADVDYPGTTVSLRIFYDDIPNEETDILEDDTALF
jgi:hypothetical protein